MKWLSTLLVALLVVSIADAGRHRHRGCGGQCGGCGSASYAGPVETLPSPTGVPPVVGTPAAGADDALAEVNAARAARGLPPFQPDPNLTAAAAGCADFRAARLMAGHTSNDFAALPRGTHAAAAGCAAWEPSFGWGSCCTYERYTYGGAAVTRGRDGRRYMHLFVR